MAGDNPFIQFQDEAATAGEGSTLQGTARRVAAEQDQDDWRSPDAYQRRGTGKGQGQVPNAATAALNSVLAYMGRTSSGATRGKSKVGNHFFDGNRNIRELLRKKVITRDQAKLLGDFHDMTPAQVRAMVEANPKKYSSFDPTPRNEKKATDARRFPGDPDAETTDAATPATGEHEVEPEDAPVINSMDPGVDPHAGVQTPRLDAGVQTPRLDAGVQTPRLDAGVETPRLDAGVETPRLDAGVEKVSPAPATPQTHPGPEEEEVPWWKEGQENPHGPDEDAPVIQTKDPGGDPHAGGAPATAKPSRFDGYRQLPDGSWEETSEGRIKRMGDEGKVAEADMRRRIAMSPSTPQGEHGSPERALYWKTKQTMVGEKARGNVAALTKSQIENPEEHAAEQYEKYNIENKTPGTNTVSGEFEHGGHTYKRDRVIITGPTGFQPGGQQASGWNDQWSIKGKDGKWHRRWKMSDKDAATITGSKLPDLEESRFKNMQVPELVEGQKGLQQEGWNTGPDQDFENPEDGQVHVNDMRETPGKSMDRTQRNVRDVAQQALEQGGTTGSSSARDNYIATEAERMRNQKPPR